MYTYINKNTHWAEVYLNKIPVGDMKLIRVEVKSPTSKWYYLPKGRKERGREFTSKQKILQFLNRGGLC